MGQLRRQLQKEPEALDKIEIKLIQNHEYASIMAWWRLHGMSEPSLAAMPIDTTFVLHLNDEPVLSVTLFLTNSSEFAMVDNLVSSPLLDRVKRKSLVSLLQDFLEIYAKEAGYAKLFCFADNKKTLERYKQLGYKETSSTISTLIKEVL